MNGVMATLWEYWGEGLRPKSRLGKVIVPLIVLKMAFIMILWTLFFGPTTQSEPGASDIDTDVFHLSTAISQDNRQ